MVMMLRTDLVELLSFGILDEVYPDHHNMFDDHHQNIVDRDEDEFEDGDIAWWRTKFIQRSSNFP